MGSHKGEAPGGASNFTVRDGHAPLSYTVDAVQGSVRLRYFAPPEQLNAYFGSLYLFTETADQYFDVTRADATQLRFMLDKRGDYHFYDGTLLQTHEIGRTSRRERRGRYG